MNILNRIVDDKKDYEDFLCPVCLLLMDKCVMFPCGHDLCQECATQLFMQVPHYTLRCPVCRTVLPEMNTTIANRNYRTELKIKALYVKCVNIELGCKATIRLKDLDDHVKTCKFSELAELIEQEKQLTTKLDIVKIKIENILLNNSSNG